MNFKCGLEEFVMLLPWLRRRVLSTASGLVATDGVMFSGDGKFHQPTHRCRIATTQGEEMKKIVSLFQRNYDGDRQVRDEIVPGAEWVAAGEGLATRKWDGTCCMVKGGKLYKRYDAKHGKTPPEGFVAAQEPDPTTGHWPGWLPVGDGPDDRWHREAFASTGDPSKPAGTDTGLPDGTYELCGPKVQGNPESLPKHTLIRHGEALEEPCPRTYEGLRAFFTQRQIEGVVWHHPDGLTMVKIKAKDFGIKRQKVAA